MAALRTALVKRRHAYTGADIPWRMDADHPSEDLSPDSRRARWRLFHYLSGGGMRAFGRPSGREVLRRRQGRFLWVTSAVAALWTLFMFL
jgi:hypothetical protein